MERKEREMKKKSSFVSGFFGDISSNDPAVVVLKSQDESLD